MTARVKRLGSQDGGAAASLKIRAKEANTTPECQRVGCDQSAIELFDDYELADSIAEITGKRPKAADEFAFYLLIIMDALDEKMPERVRRALDRSVELAFQFTETYQAALELYTLGQRGYLTGHLSAEDLIREVIDNRVHR